MASAIRTASYGRMAAYNRSMAVAIFDISTLLDSDPNFWEGRPFVRGKRVTVHRIGIAHSQGLTLEEIVENWDLEPAEVHAALAYYLANREAIDADIDEYDAESERIAAAWDGSGDTA